ncbi:MAG TPA: oligosaccharide flippase family protein [Bacteroidales bacterium]|nr:oligosaccharide flippase family protein [Bacteroidales bacterium]
MTRKFITNLALLLFLNLLVKPFWIFGIDRTVQNVTGASEYGFYFSLFSFSILLNIILDAGITNFNNRAIAQNTKLISRYFSNIITIKLLLALVYVVVVVIAGLLIGYSYRQFYLLAFLVFNQFLASFILYLRSNISGLHHFKTDSLLSVLDRIIMIILCSLLLWGNIFNQTMKIEWFVYAQTISYSLTAAIAFVLVYSKTEWFRPRFRKTYLLLILRQSYPFALLALIMTFHNRIDSVMLERMLPNGEEQAGIYAQGYRIMDAANNFALLFAGLLLPIFSRMIKEKQPVNTLVKFAVVLLIVPTISLTIGSIFYRQEIMDWLYWNHAAQSSSVFAILMTSFIGIAGSYIYGTLLTANGSLKKLNIIAGFTLVLNLLLNILLIPHYQVLGSAIACLITQVFSFTAQLIIAYRLFQFRLKVQTLWRFLIFMATAIFTGIFTTQTGLPWMVGFMLIIIVSLATAVAVKLFHLRALYAIIRYGEN